jgi:hypothetical protein
MSDPTSDPGFLTMLADKAWAIVAGLVGITWKANETKHKDTRAAADTALKAHAKEDDKRFIAVHEEQQIQRGHIAKLFDRLQEQARESDARHRELMERMHQGHTELMQALHTGLNSKADK